MAVTVILFVITLFIWIIYAYFKYTFNYWKRRQVPNMPTVIPFGNAGNPRSCKKPFYESLKNTYTYCKKLNENHAGFFMMNRPYYVPLNPEIIKNILVKDFHYFCDKGIYYNKKSDPLSANLFFADFIHWKNMRVKITPTFTTAKIKMMFNTLLACTDAMIEQIATKQVMDIKELFGCFTIDVIGSCAFGIDCNSFKNPDSKFRLYGRKLFESSVIRSFNRFITIMFPNFASALGILVLRKDVSSFFLDIIQSVVKFRENNKIERNDFIQLLIKLKEDGVLDMNELAAQSFVFFAAGYETSSITATYCLFELSKRPEMQDKIRNEIKQCVDKHGEITYDGIAEMVFLNQVIEETLRLYPILPYITRKCAEDYKIDENLTIEKGTRVLISTYGLHMDPQYFTNPETFDPERFSTENRKYITPYTYMPFGEGPRQCIGMRFGLMQTKVGLVTILKNFKLKLNVATPDKLSLHPNSFFFKCTENIILDVEKV